MRDEIGCRQDASGAGVVDPTANRRNAVRQSISPHPFGTPHFFDSAASRHWPDRPTSRCAPLLAECEKVTGVASHMSFSTAC